MTVITLGANGGHSTLDVIGTEVAPFNSFRRSEMMTYSKYNKKKRKEKEFVATRRTKELRIEFLSSFFSITHATIEIEIIRNHEIENHPFLLT